MIEEIWKSLKLQIYERAGSPLAGAFIISWILWNYRFLIVIFSDIPIGNKFLIIDTILYPEISWYILKCFAAPIITSISFIYIYPYPAKIVFEFHRKKKKELRELEQLIEDETPLTVEESRKIRDLNLKLTNEFDEKIKHYEFEINRRELLIKDLESKISLQSEAISKNNITKKTDELVVRKFSKEKEMLIHNLQVAIINAIANNNEPMNEIDIFKTIGHNDKIIMQYAFEDLTKRKLLIPAYDPRNRLIGYSVSTDALAMAISTA